MSLEIIADLTVAPHVVEQVEYRSVLLFSIAESIIAMAFSERSPFSSVAVSERPEVPSLWLFV